MLIMLSAQLLVVAIIVARLVTLQVVQEQEIRKEHALIYGGEERLEPIRGPILDRNGAVLAITGYDYRITAAPNQIQDARASASMLASVLITKTYNILSRLEPWVPDDGDPVLYSVVAPRVSAQTAQAVRELGLPGISVEPVPSRHYPQGRLFGHVLGWVDMDMNGNSGLEGNYNRELQGDAVTVRQFPILFGQWEVARPRNGATLTLTVDRTVQQVTEQVLADALIRYQARSGAIIVMDPRTFGILAMATLPSFDPSEFFREDPRMLINPCVSGWFEPGSIHKVLTMAAAIDSGTVGPETTYEDRGVLEVGGLPIYNWDRGAYGTTDMGTLLAKSLNVGAAMR
jgi:cell division protein FtsI/penicillin-binding protein 2